MLDLKDVNLDDVANALDDHSASDWGSAWLINRTTGEVAYRGEPGAVDDEYEFDDDDWKIIDPQPSNVGYGDMEDFIARVGDPRARDLLDRAIAGRGAFRRFKDTLFDFPELRTQWFAFRDVRAHRRAIEWLAGKGLIDERVADAAVLDHPDPPVGGAPPELPSAVAADLAELYGPRLVEVRLFGSHAREEATTDSDVDLLVVLDEVDDPWAEHRRMEPVLWRHTVESGVVVTALPVARRQYDRPSDPVLARAVVESIPV